jgi:hypothetical protein
VALVPAPGEHRHDVADDAEGGHGDDVQGRLPEDPGDAVVQVAGCAERVGAVAHVQEGEQQHGGLDRQDQ